MLALPRHVARSSATIGLLAAAFAALPSLDWCPLREWTAIACEALESNATCGSSRTTCDADLPSCAREASCDGASALCKEPLCDPDPDPLPFGDRLWCIRPPVIAIGAKADPLSGPEPCATFALLPSPPDLLPPAIVPLARPAPLPRPPLLRGAHAPPQPRAPPAA
jgi:hypothetical protein